MGAIGEFGLRVPRDISVIGFDDIQLSAYTMPPLTTLSLPRAEIANAAFRALLNAQSPNEKAPTNGKAHPITPELILRKSTAPAHHQSSP
jgi:DNA-binding LacI/PurR family transcriptional regulator